MSSEVRVLMLILGGDRDFREMVRPGKSGAIVV